VTPSTAAGYIGFDPAGTSTIPNFIWLRIPDDRTDYVEIWLPRIEYERPEPPKIKMSKHLKKLIKRRGWK